MQVSDFRFEVDGVAWQVTQAWFHAQDDPFPGGHRFVLRLLDPRLAKSVLACARPASALPERKTTQDVFDAVHSETTFLEGYGQDFAWMLNTVDRVVREPNGQVVVEGVCSPIARRRVRPC